MAIPPPSVLSLSAASLYALVVLVCTVAAIAAPRNPPQRWHVAVWLLLGAFFLLATVSRIYGLEEAFRASMRLALRTGGTDSERREVQRPIAAAVVALVGAGGFGLAYLSFNKFKGKANMVVLVALMSGFGLACLFAMRLISLSPIDRLLYGPIKLNWFLDIGLSMTTMAAAAYYVRVLHLRRRNSSMHRSVK